ncbi:MAG: hypothetical protein ACRDGM_07410, partial [bacterium]
MPPAKVLHCTYPYRDESGQLLYEHLRYVPKTFGFRRPDGADWIHNLEGVRHVVYRLPELQGKSAILICEGEKDVDAAWALGIPATCNDDGAVLKGAPKWRPEYSQQLKAAGVLRAAIIPDNDPQGRTHAEAVAFSLRGIGIEVRLVPLPGVPEHGDLSDYLAAGHSQAELLTLVRAVSPEPPLIELPPAPPRRFQEFGDGRYSMEIQPEGIVIEVERVRRQHQELTGELCVRVNGNFPLARGADGILTIGDLNFSSVQARVTRSKLLVERSN